MVWASSIFSSRVSLRTLAITDPIYNSTRERVALQFPLFGVLVCLAGWYARFTSPWRFGALGMLFAAASYVRTSALLLPLILSVRDCLVDRSRIVARAAGLAIIPYAASNETSSNR